MEAVMKVMVVGAAGAIGTPLVRMLVADGHEVVGTTRSQEKADRLRALGAEPVILDALDETAVGRTVAAISPEVIVRGDRVVEPRLEPAAFRRGVRGHEPPADRGDG